MKQQPIEQEVSQLPGMAVAAGQAHSQSLFCGSLLACGCGEAAVMKGLCDIV